MNELVALDSQQHRELRVSQSSATDHARSMHVINLRVPEVPQTSCDFPLFFSRASHSRQWSLSALCSFQPGNNPFVVDGQWQASYQPLTLRTYPLYLMQHDGSEKGYCAGIVPNDPALSSTEGRRLFDDTGRHSQYHNEIFRLLEDSILQDRQTFAFCQVIEQLGLLRAVDLVVQFADGSAQTIQGLHTINEDRLATLSSQERDTLVEQGYLIPLHAMLISLFQLNRVVRQHNQTGTGDALQAVRIEAARDRNAA